VGYLRLFAAPPRLRHGAPRGASYEGAIRWPSAVGAEGNRQTAVGDALRSYLARSGLATRLAHAQVIPDWPRLGRPTDRPVTVPESVTPDGTLFVRVATSAWMTELQLMGPQIMAAINAGRGAGRIKSIRCFSHSRALWQRQNPKQRRTRQRRLPGRLDPGPEGPGTVRRRPAMYIGSVSGRGLHHLVYEVVDNSVDEAARRLQHADRTFTIHADNAITVVDNGRGIPVDIHKTEKKPGVEVALTVLHAGASSTRARTRSRRTARRRRLPS